MKLKYRFTEDATSECLKRRTLSSLEGLSGWPINDNPYD